MMKCGTERRQRVAASAGVREAQAPARSTDEAGNVSSAVQMLLGSAEGISYTGRALHTGSYSRRAQPPRWATQALAHLQRG